MPVSIRPLGGSARKYSQENESRFRKEVETYLMRISADIYNSITETVGSLAVKRAVLLSEIGDNAYPTLSKLHYNVMDYGAVGDGTTDDLASIQDAIDQAEADGGGIVLFPKGTYLISNSIRVSGPAIILQGTAWGATGVPVSGDALANDFLVTVKWKRPDGGSVNTPMVIFKSGVTNGAIWGCGIRDMAFDCNITSNGLDLSGAWNGVFSNLYIAGPLGTWAEYGIRLRSSRFCSFSDIYINVTGNAVCLLLDGVTSGNGTLLENCTHNELRDITLVFGSAANGGAQAWEAYGGGLTLLGNVDNNSFFSVQTTNGKEIPSNTVRSGSGQPGNHGLTMRLGGGTEGVRENDFFYLSATVICDEFVQGNRILQMSSEGGGVEVVRDAADLGTNIPYDVVDFKAGGLYQTPSFSLRDRWHISPSEMRGIGTSPAGGALNSLWSTLDFDSATSEIAGTNLSRKLNWSSNRTIGVNDSTTGARQAIAGLVGVVVHHAHDATATGSKAVQLKLRFGQYAGTTIFANLSGGIGTAGTHPADQEYEFTVVVAEAAKEVQWDLLPLVSSFNDSTCVTALGTTLTMTSTASVSDGMVVTGPGIVAEGGGNLATTVEEILTPTTLQLSQAATAEAAVTLTFTSNYFPYVCRNIEEPLLSFSIERVGGDVADTLAEDWQLLAMTLLWEAEPAVGNGGTSWNYGYSGIQNNSAPP